MSKSFAIRMTVWTVLMLYLLCDFFLFNGPLRGELRRMFPTKEDKIAEAVAVGICARVYNAPIYLSQVDRRVGERLWRTGRDADAVGEAEMRMLRWLALDELITEALLRIKVRVNIEQAEVSSKEVDEELVRFERRFDSTQQLDEAIAAQGIESRKELRLRMQARLEQEKYLMSKMKASIAVSDEEARSWYDDHRQELTTPEQRRVRHLFIATLGKSSDEIKQMLAVHLDSIKAGKASIESLAAAVSEDEGSNDNGGDLGWMLKDRLPGDFAAYVFTMPVSEPRLIRTKLGWHIMEVTEIRAPELLPYEIMEAEIISSLSDLKRKQAIDQYRHQLRLLNHEKIEIYRQLLD